ncbi:hypothetical protein PoMZ_03344 [Pyricularia oryzae]|uniref:PD-(D/E)XK nuclease-like domain-containing protein n=1 Tax=Pyricularia oryzae TaxID=318829 RepID=A0A4P7N9J0_PYROR|nr:hypothetical protein PoMZ_03344 [Pyricularia oryzae]
MIQILKSMYHDPNQSIIAKKAFKKHEFELGKGQNIHEFIATPVNKDWKQTLWGYIPADLDYRLLHDSENIEIDYETFCQYVTKAVYSNQLAQRPREHRQNQYEERDPQQAESELAWNNMVHFPLLQHAVQSTFYNRRVVCEPIINAHIAKQWFPEMGSDKGKAAKDSVAGGKMVDFALVFDLYKPRLENEELGEISQTINQCNYEPFKLKPIGAAHNLGFGRLHGIAASVNFLLSIRPRSASLYCRFYFITAMFGVFTLFATEDKILQLSGLLMSDLQTILSKYILLWQCCANCANGSKVRSATGLNTRLG